MHNDETIIRIEIDTQPVEDTTMVIEGLGKAVQRLKGRLEQLFSDSRVEGGAFTEQMSDGLLSLRLNLGKLKKALTEAVAPIAAAVLPAINTAVRGMTAFVRSIGLVLSAVFSGSRGNDALADSAQNAAQAEEQLASAAKAAGKASLASFDKINRLNGSGGSTGGSQSQGSNTVVFSAQLQAVAQKLRALLQPLTKINLEPVRKSLAGLSEAFGELGQVLGEGLEWLWFQVLVPLATWIIEQAAPASVELLTQALRTLSAALQPVLEGLQLLLPYLEPVIAFIGQSAISAIRELTERLAQMGRSFQERSEQIRQSFVQLGSNISQLWQAVSPVVKKLSGGWSGISAGAGTAVSRIKESFNTLLGFMSGSLSGGWQSVCDGIGSIFKGAANGLIGSVNGLLSAMGTGLNSMATMLNRFSFRLPDWDILGQMAGYSFGLQLSTVTPPKIPYLAQGAVLPANRPFLAMVGDQRHGTNIEAPLTTIQEAVALVMEDLAASNLAGQEAVVGTLRQILEAVLDIQIGDDVIGSAAERYAGKMAIVRGGY